VEGEKAIISALKHHRRIRKIDIWVLQTPVGKILRQSKLDVTFGADESQASLILQKPSGFVRSRFILGWVCPTYIRHRVRWNSISSSREATLVYKPPRQSSPCQHSSFRLCFNPCASHQPLRVVKAPVTYSRIQILILRIFGLQMFGSSHNGNFRPLCRSGTCPCLPSCPWNVSILARLYPREAT